MRLSRDRRRGCVRTVARVRLVRLLNRAAWRKIMFWALLTGILLTFGSMLYLVFAYKPLKGAEAPNVTDWMQGWGSLFGLVFAAAAAVVAGAVYGQGKDAASNTEARWKQERAEAAEAARDSEERWRQELAETDRRWRKDREATDRRWAEERAELRRAADAAEEQAQLRREEQREALLAVPRAVRLTRVAVGHGQRKTDSSLAFEVFAMVHNTSDQPISNVHALITFKPDNLSFGAEKTWIDSKGSADLRWRDQDRRPQIISVSEPPIWDFDKSEGTMFWSVALHFTDAADRTWRRVDNGPPVEIPFGQLP